MLKRKGKVDPEESVEIQETSKMITPQTNTPQTNTPQKSIAANQENNEVRVSMTSDFILGPSRQASALARKALSFQKRQSFTNVCCIILCPLLMILIAAILGTVLARLIASTTTPEEFINCSNENVMSPVNIPYWNQESHPSGVFPSTPGNLTAFPSSSLDKIYHRNYASVSNVVAASIAIRSTHTCSYWFGPDYPTDISVYEKSPGVSGAITRDASFLAQPRSGWINLFSQYALGNQTYINATTQLIFSRNQQNNWYLVGYDPAIVNPLDIGVKTKQADISPLAFTALTANTSAFVSPITSQTGLLGTIPTRYYISFTTGIISPVPFYNFTSAGASEDDIDDIISSQLSLITIKIAKLDKSALFTSNQSARNQVLGAAAAITADLTYGGIYFTKLDHANKEYSWNYHIGSDSKLRSISTFPGAGRRMLLQQAMLDNAILRNGNVSGFGAAQITQGFRVLPQIDNTKLSFSVSGLIGVILFPFGVSFLLPIFSLILVQEKELRILIMMKLNGMKAWTYYISHYVTFILLYWLSILVFWGAGIRGELTLFTQTQPAVLGLLFFVWGNNLVSLSFFFAAFFNRTRFALTLIFLFVLCSVIISLALQQIFNTIPIPYSFFIWPPFAFYRALGTLNRSTFNPSLLPYSISMLKPGNEVFTALGYMAIEVPIYLLLAYYFEQILPTEFGVRRPWYFPFESIISFFNTSTRSKKEQGQKEEEMAISIKIDPVETQFEDADVKKERARVVDSSFIGGPEYPLVMKNMRKVYAGRGGQGPKLAVKDVSFAIEKDIIFGLLGPNGAGKTTLISILTGLYETSAGEAWIAGYNIKTDSAKVYKCIGICPQFDILWDDLSVSEHLYFYARLKGIKATDEKRAVHEALSQVSLLNFQDRLTKNLSGGEKRRVSIAIALLGNPKVIFFDEPTTGLDPEVRRLIWDIIQRSRIGKTIVLTTHSMEEAEALCQRIGIMAKGTLRCFGGATRLKQLYGPGFKIFINSNPEDLGKAMSYIESLLPKGWKKIDAFATNTSYEFPAEPGVISHLFAEIEKSKKNYGILDWGVGQTTLEEIFIKLISEQDAQAEY